MKHNENLNTNALWIVVDPWEKQPIKHFDQELQFSDPAVDEYNKSFLPKIVSHVKNLKHVCVLCPTDRLPVVEELSQYCNIEDSENKLIEYLIDNQLDTVVYIGYHYGHCINNRNCGARNINRYVEYLQNNLEVEWTKQYSVYKGSDWPDVLPISKFDTLSTAVKTEILNILPLSILLKFKNSHFYNKKTKIKLFIKKDLCCVYPYEIVNDYMSKKFANLI